MLGHNGGPTMEPGESWRKTCWSKARKDLLPTLPLQIVRIRVKRAQALGLDYTTYATVRATTGRDIVAFLFSDNALRLRAPGQMPPARAAKLQEAPDCIRHLAVHPPLRPETALAHLSADHGIALETVFAAPMLSQSWTETRAHLRAALGQTPSDAVLMIGDGPLEPGWAKAGALAGYVPADRYF
ncbi:MAG: hypothetical protein AAFQ36_04565 [Pseudomonadota bacterium]